MSATIITFEGLMVFKKNSNSGYYELGILNPELMGSHIPRHQTRVRVTPDPKTGSGSWEPELGQFLVSNHWYLEVRDQDGDLVTGIHADESVPDDRHSLDVGDNKFGWAINLGSNEFDSGDLTRTEGQFRPIIRLSTGSLYTYCKTGGVDLLEPSNQSNFGFMAGLLALEIDTSDVLTVALKAEGVAEPVFELPAGRDYRVEITNTSMRPTMTSHFHAYYDLVFRKVNRRYDFRAQLGVPHPNECPKVEQSERTNPVLGPFPYRCGGLLLSESSDSLS